MNLAVEALYHGRTVQALKYFEKARTIDESGRNHPAFARIAAANTLVATTPTKKMIKL